MSPLLVIALVLPSYAAGVGTRELARGLYSLYRHQENRMNARAITARVTARWVITTIFGILAIAGGLALFLAFSFRQDLLSCSTDFNDYDSMARQVRTDASAEQNQALRDAIVSAGKLIDPDVTPTAKDLTQARDDLARYVAAADRYDTATAKYPYKSFRSFCGGAK